MNKSIIVIFLIIVIFAGGFAVGRYTKSPETITVTQEKVVWKPIKKDVETMTKVEKNTALNCFYTSKPFLNVYQTPEDPFKIKADAGLCEREWSTTAKIKVKESSNWQYYVAFGVLGVGVGATAYHFLK